jgi:hypothetical protein
LRTAGELGDKHDGEDCHQHHRNLVPVEQIECGIARDADAAGADKSEHGGLTWKATTARPSRAGRLGAKARREDEPAAAAVAVIIAP